MKIGIMQPYFFPYLGYWQMMNTVDKYVIYDDVNYIKNGWINRNNILLNNSKFLITLPLEGASPFELIKNTKITSNAKAKEKLLKTITSAYCKAPYFNQVFPIIKNTIMHESLNICEALEFSIKETANYLNFKTEILLSSNLDKDNSLKAQDKVINIIKTLGGTGYINAIGGQELYDKEEFAKNGIELKFLQTHSVEYKQFKNEFVPNLSIIDVLMFNSVEEVHALLNEFSLI